MSRLDRIIRAAAPLLKGGRWACACALLSLPAAPALSGGPGSAGVQVLKSDLSPRASGMGGAFVSVADDAYMANYNPAGAGQLYMPEASAMHLSAFDDSSMQYLTFALPLPIQGLGGLDKPGFGVSALFSSAGNFIYRPIGASGGVSELSMDAETTRVMTLTYGEKVYSGEVDLEGYRANVDQYLGMSAKYISSELLETYSASALAFDFGWLLRDSNSGVALGLAVSNFGTPLKYYQEDTPLPTVLRAGVSYQRPTVMAQSVLLSLEGDLYLQEKTRSICGGLEYRLQDMFSFRLGYKGGDTNKGMTGGLGIRYESFSLDFGMTLGAAVYNATQVAFSYKFSGWRTAELKKKAKTYRPRSPEPVKKVAPPPRKAAPAKKPKKDSDFFWLY